MINILGFEQRGTVNFITTVINIRPNRVKFDRAPS